MKPHANPEACQRKIRHETMEAARETSQRLAKTKGHLLCPYFCPTCKGYHLTKGPWKTMWRRK